MELSIRLKKGGNILAAEITIKEVNAYSAITPEIYAEAEKTKLNDQIPSSLYTKFNVKRGLRDLNGNPVTGNPGGIHARPDLLHDITGVKIRPGQID